LEIEAKFRIPDVQTFQCLLEAATLAGFTLGPASAAELRDRYLDTAARALLAAGFACRLRRQGNRTLATLKGLGGAAGAVHRRIELEVDLAEPLPPADWPPSPARDLVLRVCGSEPLETLLELEQTRNSRWLHEGDRTVAELSLDRVAVRRDMQVIASYLELEAELVADGCEEDLTRLAAELQGRWGLVPNGQSKFERALVLTGVDLMPGEEDEAGVEPHLTPQERAIVERMAGEREVIARRARLLLAWDEGLSRAETIRRSGLSPRRARYWRRLFHQRGLGIFPGRMFEPAALSVPAASAGEQAPQLVHLPAKETHPVEPIHPPAEEVLPAVAVATLTEEQPSPLKGIQLLKQPGLDADDPMSEAGRKTFRFHLRRMLYYEPGTRQGQDIEDLHDMRVATRRMRAAFRVFGDYFEPQAVAPFLKGLRRTGQALGAVRDLDVFQQKVQAYRDTLPESYGSSLDGFLAVLEAQREAAREQMTDWLDSKRYHRFAEQFGEFVETLGMGSQPVAAKDGEPRPFRVRHVAPMAIYERLADLRAYDEWVSIPNPPVARLHALRIASKRLRYTIEFFAEVLGPDIKQTIKEVAALQDHLGGLQDAVVASAILRDFLVWGTWGPVTADWPMPGSEAPVIAPGVAAYLAVRQTDLQQLLYAFPPVWERITGAEFSRRVAEAVMVL